MKTAKRILHSMSELEQIRERLAAVGTEEGRIAARKFVPTTDRVYGVRVPILNQLARELDQADFTTVDELWASAFYEERLLAAKLLGRLGKKNPEKGWEVVQRLARDVNDWASCDTLATESVRPGLNRFGTTIASAALCYLEEDNQWLRRFGLVVLTNFAKDASQRPRIEAALLRASGDRRPYVKKAADWLRRDLDKSMRA